MILSQLPTGVMLAMVVGAALAVGLIAMFLTLALARAANHDTAAEKFKAELEELTKSELEKDRKDKNVVDPKTWVGYWYKLFEATGRKPATVEQPARFVLIAAIVLGSFGLLVFPGGILGLAVLPIAGVVLARAYLVMEAKKRINTLNKQLPMLISGITSNIMASQTPQNALISVAEDIPSPLGDELKIMRDELRVNVPLETALDHLAERVASRDIKFLVAAVKIASQSGSDLVPQLKIITNIIIGRTRLMQKLATAISGVTPTVWVSAIAIPAMFIFQFASGEANRSFWLTIEGIVCLIIVTGLYVGGLWFSKRMVKGVEEA